MLSCPQDKSFETTPGNPTATVMWEDPPVTDNSDQVVNVFCDPPSGSSVAIGPTLVTCMAIDGSGNKVICHFEIEIQGKYGSCKNNNRRM